MSNSSGLHYGRYGMDDAEEWMMHIGPEGAPAILFVPPLLEEMNRTRALLAATMRALAGRGLRCLLPDLPGTGESGRSIESVTCEVWRHGVAAAAGSGVAMVASLRGGALLDDAAKARCHWRFAPAEGKALVRDLDRASLAGGADWAGYAASPALRAALADTSPAQVAPLRTLRLASDRAEADARLDGPALWRRSEPGTSSELAEAMACDIHEWAGTCGVC